MKHLVQLTFVLDEDVTPDYFAQRVAQACFTHYALRNGEGIQLPSDPSKVLIKDSDPRFVEGKLT